MRAPRLRLRGGGEDSTLPAEVNGVCYGRNCKQPDLLGLFPLPRMSLTRPTCEYLTSVAAEEPEVRYSALMPACKQVRSTLISHPRNSSPCVRTSPQVVNVPNRGTTAQACLFKGRREFSAPFMAISVLYFSAHSCNTLFSFRSVHANLREI